MARPTAHLVTTDLAVTKSFRLLRSTGSILRKALGPGWRVGVACRTLVGAFFEAEDRVEIVEHWPENVGHIPGQETRHRFEDEDP